jgi:hypothetical protein
VIKLLDSYAGKEVAMFGAVWIGALPEVYVRLVSDFALLNLPDEDIALNTCSVTSPLLWLR